MLHVVMYHYVRDLPDPRYPGLKGISTERFKSQLDLLAQKYEMATLESALAHVQGDYHPKRDLCLLTFDDGLKEHRTIAAPMLATRGLQGVFFISTGAYEQKTVFPVHENQLLLATLEFEEYRSHLLRLIHQQYPELDSKNVDEQKACKAHRWDQPEIACFKYFLNACLPAEVRDSLISQIFNQNFGPEGEIAKELYLSRKDAVEMQEMGMALGGHSHTHVRLSNLEPAAQKKELQTCYDLLTQDAKPQALWPFCYPWGKRDTFDRITIETIVQLGFHCAFTSEPGSNPVGQPVYEHLRTDAAAVEGTLV